MALEYTKALGEDGFPTWPSILITGGNVVVETSWATQPTHSLRTRTRK